jgi:hypothetical protein
VALPKVAKNDKDWAGENNEDILPIDVFDTVAQMSK